MEWRKPDEVPDVAKGSLKFMIVAVFRAERKKVYVFPACYLNKYPLIYQDHPCPQCEATPEEECGADGCPSSGWFTDEPSEEYDREYFRIKFENGDEMKGWCEMPEWVQP